MNSAKALPEPAVALAEGTAAIAAANRIRERLASENEAKVGARNAQSLVLTLTDEHGQIVGGLVGETFWNTLHIELLWVADDHRSKGHGQRLMQAAETEARVRHAVISYLNTFSFQAPAFYERLGYCKYGQLNDSPKGATRMWYFKRLDRNAA